jgi:major membrane immunogen (membrane-anchored lipoprotein)
MPRWIIVLAVVLAGCGGSADKTFTEADVQAALHLTSTDNDHTWHDGNGCKVNVILNTPQEVALYMGAGDSVAADDDETVGVKAVGQTVACMKRFSAELNRLVRRG